MRATSIKAAPKLRIPRAKVVSPRRDRVSKSKREKDRARVVNGKEISVSESSSQAQIIYGRVRVGGVFALKDTNQDSKAYIVTGSSEDENELVWTAKTAGSGGNSLTITIVNPGGTNANTDFSIVGNDITVSLKTSSGTITATMAEVISRISSNPTVDALIRVRKVDSSKNGTVKVFSQTNLQYGGGTWLHHAIPITCHRIHDIPKIFINNEQVVFGASPDPRWGTGKWSQKVFFDFEYGTDDQVVNPDLHAQLPTQWDETCRLRGHAYAILILVWNKNLFAEGDPEIMFEVNGKLCYDPRSGTTVYTRNSALIAADFLMDTRYGYGVPIEKVDMDALAVAADICDEAVALAAGGTEARYYTDVIMETSQSKDQMLAQLLQAMDGDMVYVGDKYKFFAAGHVEPTVTLTASDLRSTMKISTKLSRDNTFNCVRGTYVSPEADYNETDFPAQKNSTYLAEDGILRCADLALNAVTQSCQAQRLAKIALERSRQGMTITFPTTLAHLDLIPNSTVFLDFPEYGFSNKEFEVDQVHYVEEQDNYLGLDLELRELVAEVFDWNEGEETTVDLAPDTTLPSATDVAEPSGLSLSSGTDQLYIRNDGTIWTRLKVSWTESITPFVTSGGGYRLQYRVSNPSNAWGQVIDIPGGQDFFYITDVKDGETYDVRLAAVNSLGYQSDYIEETHLVVGKTAPPSNVTSFVSSVSDLGIKLSWDDIGDVDKAGFEIREGSDWDSATIIARVRASDGRVFNYEELTAGTRTFLIKALDTSGNYSIAATSTSITINLPNVPNEFVASALANNVLLNWTTPNQSTLTVNKYRVYKGETFEDSVLIGSVFGTFHTYIERFGGTFTYWVISEDVGGNVSDPVTSTAVVTPSTDFYIAEDLQLFPYLDSHENVIVDDDNGGAIYAPISKVAVASLPLLLNPIISSETWSSHFQSNGCETIQDFLDAGFTEYLQPTNPSAIGNVEFLYDYAVTFPAIFIDFSFVSEVLGGSITLTPYLSTSPDGVAWTDYNDTQQIFGTDVRYVKYGIDIEGADDESLVKLTAFRAILQVQRAEETQLIDALAGDSGGTTITFTHLFLDVEDIQVSVNSDEDSRVIYKYDYETVPAVQTALLFAFDSDGVRADRQVSVRIRGVISPGV